MAQVEPHLAQGTPHLFVKRICKIFTSTGWILTSVSSSAFPEIAATQRSRTDRHYTDSYMIVSVALRQRNEAHYTKGRLRFSRLRRFGKLYWKKLAVIDPTVKEAQY